MLVFGGVASAADDASPRQATSAASPRGRLQPAFANDLWELDVGQLTYAFVAHARANHTRGDDDENRHAQLNGTHGGGWEIPEGGVAFVSIDVNASALLRAQRSHRSQPLPFGRDRSPADLCIVAVEVTVNLRHPCTRQLELVLFGPGPRSGDANHEPSSHAHATLLFDHHDGTANSG
jgi:hypothetical protein